MPFLNSLGEYLPSGIFYGCVGKLMVCFFHPKFCKQTQKQNHVIETKALSWILLR